MGNGASISPGEEYHIEDQAFVGDKLKYKPNVDDYSKKNEKDVDKHYYFVNNTKEETQPEDDNPMTVLLEFIPYYGKDDPANDALVRSTLSNLSIAEIDYRDDEGNTLLLLASQYGCEDLVRMMLIKGANPNALNSHGVGCLHYACYRESASKTIAKVLLQHGANPEIQESTYGCTPLHYCAGNGDIEFCRLLLTHGAQADTYDFFNYTCVDYAREAGMNEAANYLQEILVKSSTNKALKSGAVSPSSKSNSNNDNKRIDNAGNVWQSYFDSQSNQTYLINSNNGECLWEVDFISKFSKQSNFLHDTSPPNIISNQVKAPEADMLVVSKACRARLVGLFSKLDPARLVEVDELIKQFNGKELELMDKMSIQYNLSNDTEFLAFRKKLKNMKGISDDDVGSNENYETSGTGNIDPNFAQALVKDTEAKYENQIETLKSQYRCELSDKDGLITKLQLTIDNLIKEKQSLEVFLFVIFL